MRAIIYYATVGVFIPRFVSADAVTVESGVKSELTTHARYDTQCRSTPVSIKIREDPANGKVTAEPKSFVIRAEPERGVPQQSHCIGKTVDGVAIYYESKSGFVGQDSFRYQRLNPKDPGDRFNTEVSYTITVK